MISPPRWRRATAPPVRRWRRQRGFIWCKLTTESVERARAWSASAGEPRPAALRHSATPRLFLTQRTVCSLYNGLPHGRVVLSGSTHIAGRRTFLSTLITGGNGRAKINHRTGRRAPVLRFCALPADAARPDQQHTRGHSRPLHV